MSKRLYTPEFFSGKNFSYLTSSSRMKKVGKHWYVHCSCRCGGIKYFRADHIVYGRVKSCGCYSRERASINNATHKMSKTNLYAVWLSMRARCSNKNNTAYKHYGLRGIKVCRAWLKSPEAFLQWAKQNAYAKGKILDRIDVNGDYTPKNCRFVSPKLSANNKTNTKRFIFNGRAMTIAEASDVFNIPQGTIWMRMYRQKLSPTESILRPTSKKVEFHRGEFLTFSAAEKKYGLGRGLLWQRIRRDGYTPLEAITEKVR